MSDDGERYVIDWCHAIGAKVYVRGTDARPVIAIMSKGPICKELGGSEIRRRMEVALRDGGR